MAEVRQMSGSKTKSQLVKWWLEGEPAHGPKTLANDETSESFHTKLRYTECHFDLAVYCFSGIVIFYMLDSSA